MRTGTTQRSSTATSPPRSPSSKEQPGRELQVHGSGTLARTLIANDLVDEFRLLIFPVIVGAGRRLFADTKAATGLGLVEARTTSSGVAILVYQSTGRPEFGEIEPG